MEEAEDIELLVEDELLLFGGFDRVLHIGKDEDELLTDEEKEALLLSDEEDEDEEDEDDDKEDEDEDEESEDEEDEESEDEEEESDKEESEDEKDDDCGERQIFSQIFLASCNWSVTHKASTVH
ncbi:hypothetical protein A3D11_04560 [Candidatus Peribacteria bacterium RIFCSPHIGHO2_02_FULL_49_16]|nr:MAG: hypothetical protein A2880_04125 [Candidatus Peribacteria bacterium RIFCSPHIGHO2_01_FULL_49_38]OGJ58971.1 MAG: hypothetical protein A3D11_04560 [Candidatus Peribacteria bacterium RIFCSPHIGHO2_02_FULL_49_16]